jgi:hypothetical protein
MEAVDFSQVRRWVDHMSAEVRYVPPLLFIALCGRHLI